MRSTIAAVVTLASFSAGAALASPPDVATSSYPSQIRLVGSAQGTPDVLGTATYVIRRHGDPHPGCAVFIDFSQCPDVRLASDVLFPGVVVNCSSRHVYGVTDVDGVVTFRIVANGSGSGSASLACAQVWADGVPFPPLAVTAFDLDGQHGVDARDISILAASVFSGIYRPRGDYDGDGDTDPVDLGALYGTVVRGGSTASGTACP